MHLGGCLFGSRIVQLGEHTFRSRNGCMQMLCEGDGQLSFGE